MMCVNFLNIQADLTALENAGIEYLHFDIMDGSFVPNYTLGPCMINSLRDVTRITFDIHLMVERPEDKLEFFDIRKGDYVSFHAEATNHIQRLLTAIRKLGAHPGVAINPGTPVCVLEPILDDLDFVLVMTVNPGFAGQKLVPQTLKKIAVVRSMIDHSGYPHIKLQVDGNVSFENAKKMREAGADIFVAGTAGLFRADMSIAEGAGFLRAAIE
jgi:ribulose-phosphate 3-epimerase